VTGSGWELALVLAMSSTSVLVGLALRGAVAPLSPSAAISRTRFRCRDTFPAIDRAMAGNGFR
jgi:hypothetical protein